MRTSRLIAIGFLALCGLVVGLVAAGLVNPSAPVAVFPTAQPRPTEPPDPSKAITLEFVYSTEKREWMDGAPQLPPSAGFAGRDQLQGAIDQWLATNPTVDGRPITVKRTALGSQEIVAGLQNGSLKPAAISPASTMQLAQINQLTVDGTTNLAADAQPLVLTPLVLFAFKDTPAAKLAGNPQFWQELQRLVVEPARAQRLKFAQTSPDTSNSGLQTMLLMAYAFRGKADNLAAADIASTEFRTWWAQYAKNVEKFGRSTGPIVTEVLQFGPSRYSAVALYENLAVENLRTALGRNYDPVIIYPPQNIYSDHPFAVLDAPWVSAEQREAAEQLRAFLLQEPAQRNAVLLGFRPANDAVKLDIPGSPFAAPANLERGLQPQLSAPLVAAPPAEVVTAMLDFWTKEVRPDPDVTKE
ncbi:MAG TPA: extracellular solute-binding protein [Herpetosiphonaceae bacterium]